MTNQLANKLRIMGIIVCVLFALSLGFQKSSTIVLAAGTSYYVSSSAGNDSNSGTSSSTPWKTLKKASGILQPGDKILLKCGDTWTGEELMVSGNSTSADYIEITSYSTGAKPIIEGISKSKDKCITIIDGGGFRISNLELRSANVGIYILYSMEKTNFKDILIENCYLHEIDYVEQDVGISPAIVVGTNNTIPSLPVLKGITVRNCEFKNCYNPFTSGAKGYSIGAFEDLTYQNNYHEGEAGVKSSGLFPQNLKNGIISGNTFFNIGGNLFMGAASAGIGCSENVVIENNEFAYTRVENSVPDGCGFDFEVGDMGNYFRNNLIHHSDGDGILFMVNPNDPRTHGNLVENNILYYNAQNPSNSTYNCEIYIGNASGIHNSNVLKNNTYYRKSGTPKFHGDASDFAQISENDLDITTESNGGNYALNATATASSNAGSSYTPDKAKDNNDATMWKSASGTSAGEWLQLEFPSGTTVNKFQILEDSGSSISKYVIQAWDSTNSGWKSVFSGKTIGTMYMPILPVTTTKVRILVKSTSSGSPAIKEFRVYNVTRSSFAEPSQDACSNLLGQWKLDENSGDCAHDTSALHHDGQVINAAWTAGKYGSGLSFNGTSGKSVMTAFMDANPGKTFTMSAWVKPVQDRTNYRVIFSKGITKDEGHFEFYISPDGKFNFYAPDLGDYSSNTVIDDNNWHHLVATYDSSTLKLYVDKTQKLSATISNKQIVNEYEMFRIGCLADGTLPFNGVLDDIRIFNKALDSTQINNLYEGNNPTASPTPTPTPLPTPTPEAAPSGIQAWWKMNEVGKMAMDWTGGNNHAVLNGPDWSSSRGDSLSLDFDGVNDYAEVTNCGVNIGNSFSITGWIKATAHRGSYQALLAKGPKNSGHFELNINSSGYLQFYSNDIGTFNSNIVVDDGRWHHVAVTYNGSTVNMYVDSVNRGSTSASGTVSSEIETLRFGTLVDGTLPYDGNLDDFRIYTTALSSSSISDLYYGNRGYLLYYNFDKGSGSVLEDSCGDLNGTISGAVWWLGNKYNPLSNTLHFDGVDDSVTVSNSGLNLGNKFSIGLWMWAQSGRDKWHTLLSKGPKDSGHYEISITPGGYAEFYSYELGTIDSTSVVDDNKWHYITVTYDGSTKKIYVDGILSNSASQSGTPTWENETLKLGMQADGTFPYLGSLDGVRVYNRVLADYEVERLFNTGW